MRRDAHAVRSGRSTVPRPAGPFHRRISPGRSCGFRRAHGRREAHGQMGSARDRRKPPRCCRQHRHRGGGESRTGRTYAAFYAAAVRYQPFPVSEAAVRGIAVRSGDRDRDVSQHPCRSSSTERHKRPGLDRLGAEESRQAQLFLAGRRHHSAPYGRDVQVDGRRAQNYSRAIQRRRTTAHRHAGGGGGHDVL